MRSKEKLAAKGQLVSIVLISLIAIVLIIGASLKHKPKLVVVEATAEQVVPINSTVEPEPEPVIENRYPVINKVYYDNNRFDFISGDKLYMVTQDSAGWADPQEIVLDTIAMQTACLVYEDDKIVVGGNRLLITSPDYAELYDQYDLDSPINVILPFGEGYLVGANDGLYFVYDCYEDTIIKEDILVSALAEDVGGLWVGTFGDGLWRFDGERWQRRYLLRDTTIFDFVTALEYSYPFLWVGTPSGIFRYDGGSWSQLFVSDSSEIYEVNCFLPRALNTYIGTEQGLFVYANDTLSAVPDFENEHVIGLFKGNKDIFVATRENGILTLKGKEEILRPDQLPIKEPYLADIK